MISDWLRRDWHPDCARQKHCEPKAAVSILLPNIGKEILDNVGLPDYWKRAGAAIGGFLIMES